MSDEKQYYAFISYNHADKKAARELQRWLEYYKLPQSIRRENANLPKYVRPVFRDVTNLEVGELSSQIKDALTESHYLIVVCSPRATQSEWVNKEIECFILLGRQDKIIPYIIDGIPHAKNPQEECYPPALLMLSKQKEILGANINETGKDSAAIRLVAKMFNLRSDVLFQRYQRERRKKIFSIIISIIIFVLILMTFIYALLLQNITIQNQYDALKIQEGRLRNDSVVMTSQMDSIRLRDSLILIQQDSIATTNANLTTTNIKLQIERDNVIQERDNVKKANWENKKIQSRAIAGIVQRLLDEGNIRAATLLALEVLPCDYENPDKPWTIEADSALRRAASYAYMCHHAKVWEAAFSNDGRWIATASSDKTIGVWDAKTCMQVHSLRGHTHSVRSLAFHPDNRRIASASCDGTVRIWDIDSGIQLKRIETFHSESIYGVRYNHKGNMIAVMTEDHVYLLDTVVAEPIFTISKDTTTHYFSSITFSPDDSKLLTVYDTIVDVWDVKSRKIIKTLSIEGSYAYLSGADFSPNGEKIVTSSWDHIVRVWDMDSGKQLQEFKLHDAAVTSVTYSADGNFLATSLMDQTVLIIDPITGNIVKKIGGYNGSVNSVSFSPDGLFLLTASNDSTVRLTPLKSMVRSFRAESEMENEELVRKIKNSSEYSPDGKRVISIEDDHVLRILDVATGVCVQVLEDNTDEWKKYSDYMRYKYYTTTNSLEYASFSEDGKFVTAYYDDGEIKMWPASDIRNIIEELKRRYKNSELTPEERRKYYLE